MVSHVDLDQDEVFDVLADFDLFKLLLLISGIILNEALPLRLCLRLFIEQAVGVDLA